MTRKQQIQNDMKEWALGDPFIYLKDDDFVFFDCEALVNMWLDDPEDIEMKIELLKDEMFFEKLEREILATLQESPSPNDKNK
jgi:hypothetical protein